MHVLDEFYEANAGLRFTVEFPPLPTQRACLVGVPVWPVAQLSLRPATILLQMGRDLVARHETRGEARPCHIIDIEPERRTTFSPVARVTDSNFHAPPRCVVA